MLEAFSFELPPKLIAQQPASPRDHARLLVYNRADRSITDSYFYNLAKFLPDNTTLVLNRAKVDKCRLRFGSIEVFLTQTFNGTTAQAMVKPGRKFKIGNTVKLSDDITATVTHIDEDGLRTLDFSLPLDDPAYDAFRLTPLPPYIKQDERLSDEYQTVYAKDVGSKAAPTAGLHFTDELLTNIKQSYPVVEVTLDVGLGTFAPLKAENIAQKRLHEETYTITPEAADLLNQATHITAVGTTTVRVLESCLRSVGRFEPRERAVTDIFIQPDDELQAVNAMITNFHLPKTSLLMLVAALTGTDELMRIYHHAIDEKYRFYSFGDAMLII